MSNHYRHEFKLSFANQPYCPECAVPLTDDNASVVHSWLYCAQCAFKGGLNIGVIEHAEGDYRISRHLSESRRIRAYTPKPPIHVAVPLVELIIASNDCSLTA